MTTWFYRHRVRFYLSISTLVISLVILLTALIMWDSHRESTAAARQMADRLFGEITASVIEKVQSATQTLETVAQAGAAMPGMQAKPVIDGLGHGALPFMFLVLDNNPWILSCFVGFQDGSFLQAFAPQGRKQPLAVYEAPPDTHYMVMAIGRDGDGARKAYWRFLDQQRKVIAARTIADPAFDPRSRSWYRQAITHGGNQFVGPYVFSLSKAPGFTCARALTNTGGVFGLDMTLAHYSGFLKSLRISENGSGFIINPQQRLLAHPTETVVDVAGPDGVTLKAAADADDIAVKTIAARLAAGPGPRAATTVEPIGGRPYLVRTAGIDPQGRLKATVSIAAPLSDFTEHIRRMQIRTSAFALAMLALFIPLVLFMSRRIATSLSLLSQEAEKVRRFDFSDSPPFDSAIKEVHSLIMAFGLMKATIRQRTEELIATQKKLEKLVDGGISLSAERNVNRLVELIFLAAKELTNADGGVLYLCNEAGKQALPEIFRLDSAELIFGGSTGGPVPLPAVDLDGSEGGKSADTHIIARAIQEGITLVEGEGGSGSACTQTAKALFSAKMDYCPRTLVVAPLKTRRDEVIGALMLLDAQDPDTNAIVSFSDGLVGFVEALAAQAAVSLDNQHLLAAQEALLDAIIQVLAGAIDAKSPYTGGHCSRVPVVAEMLARAASEVTEGALADFEITSDDQWREFHIAAWLHDCGKVTTPEYVVDKATKLETLYNRLHEVRMRFEVLWRDAEIDCCRRQLAGENAERLAAELARTRDRIRDDFAFVAECNVGGEYMSDDKIARLEAIGRQTWLRHLDDRIGLSQDELARKSAQPPQPLPALETLLADKPEHCLPRGDRHPFGRDNPHGFRMQVPENLYNLGELANLSVRKGTLTSEERFKINEHIVQTIIMLENLPLPKTMRRVPEIAGAHHETMVGTGYPRKLTREQMSIPARIMAIADIFEALTASDRPYKKAKPLSEAIKIMGLMRNGDHIDPDLFTLFLTSGVYRRYAEQFLAPEQCDAVEVEKYLGPTSRNE
jgi:HD-GYP domain-containing protein (c-di-GMP phosphodiesterase class II)/HAMP domain-containing protein